MEKVSGIIGNSEAGEGRMTCNIESIRMNLHNALDNAEQTRKRTKSSEDREYVIQIRNVVVALWGEFPEKRGG